MITLILTACPDGLRGHLTRWLLEASAGVFVGRVSARVRDELWDRTVELIGSGRALLIYAAPTEQGFSVRSHGHHWNPVDCEGVTLMLRPQEPVGESESVQRGWSGAARRRRRRK